MADLAGAVLARLRKGAVMQNALAKSLKIFAYVVLLLMVVGMVYASYISLRYFNGIGV
jgi:hypothetical protein